MNILDILFPKHCVGCGRLGRYFCPGCISAIQTINAPICPACENLAIDGATHPGCRTRYCLDGLTSFFRYDGVVRKAIKGIKYRLIFDLAVEFISLIPDVSFSRRTTLLSLKGQSSVLVPIPLHPSRLRERGFNQAEVLGKAITDKLNIPLRTDILLRVKRTIPQVEMKSKDARLKNMDGVFAVNQDDDSLGPVVLVDDVFTTGATMRAAANTLKRIGAPFVWGITIAR
ncbi:ComF family protein [Candidatus Gottesmanbacteria bacterium]|nr:ComF family protein [Candidatus Gottesmanbacteria bacterium]